MVNLYINILYINLKVVLHVIEFVGKRGYHGLPYRIRGRCAFISQYIPVVTLDSVTASQSMYSVQ